MSVSAAGKEKCGGGDGGVSDQTVEHLAFFADEAGVIEENDHAVF